MAPHRTAPRQDRRFAAHQSRTTQTAPARIGETSCRLDHEPDPKGEASTMARILELRSRARHGARPACSSIQVSRKPREKLSKTGLMMYSKNVRSPVLM